MLVKTVISI